MVTTPKRPQANYMPPDESDVDEYVAQRSVWKKESYVLLQLLLSLFSRISIELYHRE